MPTVFEHGRANSSQYERSFCEESISGTVLYKTSSYWPVCESEIRIQRSLTDITACSVSLQSFTGQTCSDLQALSCSSEKQQSLRIVTLQTMQC